MTKDSIDKQRQPITNHSINGKWYVTNRSINGKIDSGPWAVGKKEKIIVVVVILIYKSPHHPSNDYS